MSTKEDHADLFDVIVGQDQDKVDTVIELMLADTPDLSKLTSRQYAALALESYHALEGTEQVMTIRRIRTPTQLRDLKVVPSSISGTTFIIQADAGAKLVNEALQAARDAGLEVIEDMIIYPYSGARDGHGGDSL